MMLKGSAGEPYRLEAKPFKSHSGEGDIYRLTNFPDQVVKLYHPDRLSKELEQKLLTMANHPPNEAILSQIAWPMDVVYDLGRNFRGFVMPLIDAADELDVIYTYPPVRNITYRAKLVIAQNICAVISEVHKAGFIFGDFNPRNIGVNINNGLVAFWDTDSYHIVSDTYEYRCKVCRPGYAAPELIAKCEPYGDDAYAAAPLPTFTQETDNFALAIHIFKLLMNGYTPFNGIRETESASAASPGVDNQAIKRDSYCFKPGNKPLSAAVPPLTVLPPEVANLFTRAFIHGRRDPKQRPTAVEWYRALRNYESALVPCPKNSAHMYLRGLPACPWCEADSRFQSANAPRLSQRTLTGQMISPPPPPPPPVIRAKPIVSAKDLVGIWTGSQVSSSGDVPYLYFSFPGRVYCIHSNTGRPSSYEFSDKYLIADSYSISVNSAGETVCDFGTYSAVVHNIDSITAAGGGIDGTYSSQNAPPPPPPPPPPASVPASSGSSALSGSSVSSSSSQSSASQPAQTSKQSKKKTSSQGGFRWFFTAVALLAAVFLGYALLDTLPSGLPEPDPLPPEHGLTQEEYIPLGEVECAAEYCTGIEEKDKKVAFGYSTDNRFNSTLPRDNFGTYYWNRIVGTGKDVSDTYNETEAWREYLLDGSYREIRGRIILPFGSRTNALSESYLRIFGDGVEVYCSEPVTAGCEVQDFTVDISSFSTLKVHIQGCQILYLVDCGFYRDSSVPTVSTALEPRVYSKPQIYLSELPIFDISKGEDKRGDGDFSDRGETTDNRGTTYSSGCCLFYYNYSNDKQPGKEIWCDFRLNGRYRRLEGAVVLNGEYNYPVPENTYFAVYGDGELLYQSLPLEEGCEPQNFDLDISGVTSLRVATTDHTNEVLRIVDCMLYAEQAQD